MVQHKLIVYQLLYTPVFLQRFCRQIFLTIVLHLLFGLPTPEICRHLNETKYAFSRLQSTAYADRIVLYSHRDRFFKNTYLLNTWKCLGTSRNHLLFDRSVLVYVYIYYWLLARERVRFWTEFSDPVLKLFLVTFCEESSDCSFI